jgi:hypothetical protein
MMSPRESDGPNPYAPPAQEDRDIDPRPGEAADGPLFSPTQIGVATVFGSVIGGGLLLQANYRTLREGRGANLVIAGVVVATAILHLLVIIFQGTIERLAIAATSIVSFCVMVSRLQGDFYAGHALAGGPRRSSWWVLGAILVSLAVRGGASLALQRVLHALRIRL